jgi:hypothetical protein
MAPINIIADFLSRIVNQWLIFLNTLCYYSSLSGS